MYAIAVEPTVKVAIEDAKSMKPVGESITLLCEVEGNPKPVLSWSLREQTIIPSPGRVHISKGGQRYLQHCILFLCTFGTFLTQIGNSPFAQ
jgi:hypothetical protein